MRTVRNGFTLIELLVVISIIAILSTIGLLTYSSVLEQGRDSKRQADLRLIQSALEQYHADQKFYPKQVTLFFRNCEDGLNGYLHMILNTECPLKDSTGTKTYLNKVPKDPRSAGFYKYVALPDSPLCNNSTVLCTSYCLFAKMEDSTNATSIPTQCSSSLPAGFNHVVTPP